MDPHVALTAFDQQLRRRPPPDEPGRRAEVSDRVIRSVPVERGWTAVTWTDLDAESVDSVIAEQVDRFADLEGPWEWKYYSYDQPQDLPDRLLAAGFTPEPVETLLVAEISELPPAPAPVPGITLVDVVDAATVAELVSVHDTVFGDDNSAFGRELSARLHDDPPTVAAVVARAGDTPICAGRVEFHHGTDFASLWGGGTVAAWRGRGVFKTLVAHRAAAAAAHGFRFLQVDATDESRPILERLGFVAIAQTTPYIYAGR